MDKFEDFKIKKQLLNALTDLGLTKPTPIQIESYSTILAGRDFVGIAQTGTGKTFAFLLPILQDLSYSDQLFPRVLILAPTRELVIQIVKEIEKLTPSIKLRVAGVYGGTNINTQKKAINNGLDILVGTPQRTYDLALTKVLRLSSIKKLVIDEVDIMLDFGYRTQLRNIFGYLPAKRQNILFSATMTTHIDELINGFLLNPVKKTISISGTPLVNITQASYTAPNFYSKVNLLNHLLKDKTEFNKVLIFVGSKVKADRLYEALEFEDECSVIHSSKTQSHRNKAIEDFKSGRSRILVATDVISRGIDISKISTVISFDTPKYPENYIHRIGRTGRAEEEGKAILLFTDWEEPLKEAIEKLMKYSIPFVELPEEVEVTTRLVPEEEEIDAEIPEEERPRERRREDVGDSFHEKSAKNSKEKIKKIPYEMQMKKKFKKSLRRGDKIQNTRKNRKRR